MERKSIPKPLRTLVWNKYIGEEHGLGKCNVCATKIKVSNFDCGHIVAACEGGEDIIQNLVPICRLCNLSMGKENLNDFKKRYFNDKSYIDIYTTCFLMKTDEKRNIKGYMGFKSYEYPIFLSYDEIYNDYKKWIYYNHIHYYEKVGMNSWYKSPDKNELIDKLSNIYGPLVKDPSMINGPYGFNNIKFK